MNLASPMKGHHPSEFMGQMCKQVIMVYSYMLLLDDL